MSDLIRLTVERVHQDPDTGTITDAVAIKSDWTAPRSLTGVDDTRLAEWVWAMIARTAFEADAGDGGRP